MLQNPPDLLLVDDHRNDLLDDKHHSQSPVTGLSQKGSGWSESADLVDPVVCGKGGKEVQEEAGHPGGFVSLGGITDLLMETGDLGDDRVDVFFAGVLPWDDGQALFDSVTDNEKLAYICQKDS